MTTATKDPRPVITAARFVTVELAAVMTGLSAGAIRKRIERGVWLENKEWRRGPDERVWIDTKGIEAWVLQKSAAA
ncbi:excisionase [Diaphorobacter sp. HDW4B]|uniref:excisionase n=1 Tax=Diaphorobacter sp. HDW4B TaxID=2714925 RepID=UPI00140C0163|nr:excisionase [Diaphorobacter sp. HDW4B]QIL69593.1 excisionase [Diaphorobacter sp. HDW4B]